MSRTFWFPSRLDCLGFDYSGLDSIGVNSFALASFGSMWFEPRVRASPSWLRHSHPSASTHRDSCQFAWNRFKSADLRACIPIQNVRMHACISTGGKHDAKSCSLSMSRHEKAHISLGCLSRSARIGRRARTGCLLHDHVSRSGHACSSALLFGVSWIRHSQRVQ